MGDVNHLRVVWSGKRKNADLAGEIWQFGIHMMPTLGSAFTSTGAPPLAFTAASAALSASGSGYTISGNYLLEGGVNDIDPVDYINDQCRVAITDYLAAASLFPLDVYCDEIEVYPIGADGHVLGDVNGIFKASLSFTSNTVADGTTTGASFSPFTSWGVSLKTPANTPRGRGRFFPPPIATAYVNTVTGLMDATQRGTYATSAEAFLTNASFTDGVNNVYVRPVVIGSPFTTAYPVTAVTVDNIPDTQRRRKNGLTSVRTQVAFTP